MINKNAIFRKHIKALYRTASKYWISDFTKLIITNIKDVWHEIIITYDEVILILLPERRFLLVLVCYRNYRYPGCTTRTSVPSQPTALQKPSYKKEPYLQNKKHHHHPTQPNHHHHTTAAQPNTQHTTDQTPTPTPTPNPTQPRKKKNRN